MKTILVSNQTTVLNKKYVLNQTWDFLLLGGGSLIGLFCLKALLHDQDLAFSYAATIFLANFVNHPHFAHSYQMFYRDFQKKITIYPYNLRIRYFVSGIVVPVFLASFFFVAIYCEFARALGLAANLMFFLVGWHYVKQGYGMLMVDAVLKKAFFSEMEKKFLLQNAYATWIFVWLAINYSIQGKAAKYFEITYFVIPVMWQVIAFAGLLFFFTTMRAAIFIYKRRHEGKPIAWNGILAYIVSLYAWLLIRDPLVLLWIPLFHSLQYMAIVWRYEFSRTQRTDSNIKPWLRFALFGSIGLILGYLGFWVLPGWLNENINYSKELFGTSLFFYVFWIFINVHHYTMDAVMWRKGNPDVQIHLFSNRKNL